MFQNRRWKIIILFCVFFALILFLSYRANPSSEASWIDRMSYRLVSPFSTNLHRVYHWIGNKIDAVLDASDLQSKNKLLEKENQRLKQELFLLEEFKTQTLQANADYEKLNLKKSEAIPARVVSFDVRSAYQSILINVGEKSGVKVNQTVVADGGLVGRVIKVAPGYSQVLLINDPRSQVDILEKESRARGTLIGKKKSLRLSTEYFSTKADYFSVEAPLKKGQLLLTTGQDGLFPKGIPVGTLEKIKRDSRGLFWQAEVEPVAGLHQLEEVLVMKK